MITCMTCMLIARCAYTFVLPHLLILILHALHRTSQIVRLLPPVTVSEDEESDISETGPVDRESGEAEDGEGSAEDQMQEKEDSLNDESIMKSKSKGKGTGTGKDMSRPRGNSIVHADSDEEVGQILFLTLNPGMQNQDLTKIHFTCINVYIILLVLIAFFVSRSRFLSV